MNTENVLTEWELNRNFLTKVRDSNILGLNKDTNVNFYERHFADSLTDLYIGLKVDIPYGEVIQKAFEYMLRNGYTFERFRMNVWEDSNEVLDFINE